MDSLFDGLNWFESLKRYRYAVDMLRIFDCCDEPPMFDEMDTVRPAVNLCLRTPDFVYPGMTDASVQIVKESAGARKLDIDCNYFVRDPVMNFPRFPKIGTATLPDEKIEVRVRYFRKKVPSRSWSGEETDAVLHLMTEAVDEGPGIWDYISGNLFERYYFDRASDSCKQQWHTLLQNYRDIREHESKTPRKSFWDMNEDERSKKKLPRTFNFEWCEMIEKMGSAVDDIDAECEPDEGLTDESAAATDEHSYVSQCDEVVESNAGRKRSFDDEDHLLMKNITTLVNQRVEDALKPRPKIQKLDKL